MWFRQLQLFQFNEASSYTAENLTNKLEALAFQPCLPSFPASAGWVPPVEEENSALARGMKDCIMICLQIEEKILPATVVRQKLNERIKEKEAAEDRKIRNKEKLNLKDELIFTLLPMAFSKLTRIYAYIDTKNQWLLLDTTNEKKTEQFISLFKKSISEHIYPFELKKIPPIMTHWLKHKNYPTSFAVEKAGVLFDPSQQSRVIRCQQQDLFANSIQSLLKDGCEAKQLALSWQDRVNFVLGENLMLTGIKFEDEIKEQTSDMEAETKEQRFDADFLIMGETFASMLNDLLEVFINIESTEVSAA